MELIRSRFQPEPTGPEKSREALEAQPPIGRHFPYPRRVPFARPSSAHVGVIPCLLQGSMEGRAFPPKEVAGLSSEGQELPWEKLGCHRAWHLGLIAQSDDSKQEASSKSLIPSGITPMPRSWLCSILSLSFPSLP